MASNTPGIKDLSAAEWQQKGVHNWDAFKTCVEVTHSAPDGTPLENITKLYISNFVTKDDWLWLEQHGSIFPNLTELDLSDVSDYKASDWEWDDMRYMCSNLLKKITSLTLRDWTNAELHWARNPECCDADDLFEVKMVAPRRKTATVAASILDQCDVLTSLTISGSIKEDDHVYPHDYHAHICTLAHDMIDHCAKSGLAIINLQMSLAQITPVTKILVSEKARQQLTKLTSIGLGIGEAVHVYEHGSKGNYSSMSGIDEDCPLKSPYFQDHLNRRPCNEIDHMRDAAIFAQDSSNNDVDLMLDGALVPLEHLRLLVTGSEADIDCSNVVAIDQDSWDKSVVLASLKYAGNIVDSDATTTVLRWLESDFPWIIMFAQQSAALSRPKPSRAIYFAPESKEVPAADRSPQRVRNVVIGGLQYYLEQEPDVEEKPRKLPPLREEPDYSDDPDDDGFVYEEISAKKLSRIQEQTRLNAEKKVQKKAEEEEKLIREEAESERLAQEQLESAETEGFKKPRSKRVAATQYAASTDITMKDDISNKDIPQQRPLQGSSVLRVADFIRSDAGNAFNKKIEDENEEHSNKVFSFRKESIQRERQVPVTEWKASVKATSEDSPATESSTMNPAAERAKRRRLQRIPEKKARKGFEIDDVYSNRRTPSLTPLPTSSPVPSPVLAAKTLFTDKLVENTLVEDAAVNDAAMIDAPVDTSVTDTTTKPLDIDDEAFEDAVGIDKSISNVLDFATPNFDVSGAAAVNTAPDPMPHTAAVRMKPVSFVPANKKSAQGGQLDLFAPVITDPPKASGASRKGTRSEKGTEHAAAAPALVLETPHTGEARTAAISSPTPAGKRAASPTSPTARLISEPAPVAGKKRKDEAPTTMTTRKRVKDEAAATKTDGDKIPEFIDPGVEMAAALADDPPFTSSPPDRPKLATKGKAAKKTMELRVGKKRKAAVEEDEPAKKHKQEVEEALLAPIAEKEVERAATISLSGSGNADEASVAAPDPDPVVSAPDAAPSGPQSEIQDKGKPRRSTRNASKAAPAAHNGKGAISKTNSKKDDGMKAAATKAKKLTGKVIKNTKPTGKTTTTKTSAGAKKQSITRSASVAFAPTPEADMVDVAGTDGDGGGSGTASGMDVRNVKSEEITDTKATTSKAKKPAGKITKLTKSTTKTTTTKKPADVKKQFTASKAPVTSTSKGKITTATASDLVDAGVADSVNVVATSAVDDGGSGGGRPKRKAAMNAKAAMKGQK